MHIFRKKCISFHCFFLQNMLKIEMIFFAKVVFCKVAIPACTTLNSYISSYMKNISCSGVNCYLNRYTIEESNCTNHLYALLFKMFVSGAYPKQYSKILKNKLIVKIQFS